MPKGLGYPNLKKAGNPHPKEDALLVALLAHVTSPAQKKRIMKMLNALRGKGGKGLSKSGTVRAR